jgi:hypothetical protein
MTIPIDKRGPGGRRLKPPLILKPLHVPAGIPLDEWAVPVATAAEFTGVTVQAIHKMIELRTLPAYLGPGGFRFVTINDLAESAAGSRQAARDAELNRRLAWHEFRCVDPWETCTTCGGAQRDQFDRWEAEPMPKRIYAPARLAKLAEARKIKAAGDIRRREEREKAKAAR